jgi:hypothetical protein
MHIYKLRQKYNINTRSRYRKHGQSNGSDRKEGLSIKAYKKKKTTHLRRPLIPRLPQNGSVDVNSKTRGDQFLIIYVHEYEHNPVESVT